MSTLFQRAFQRIEENQHNAYNCIPFNGLLPRFSEYLPGITKSTYYLITANAKVGKTQFTDSTFFYYP